MGTLLFATMTKGEQAPRSLIVVGESWRNEGEKDVRPTLFWKGLGVWFLLSSSWWNLVCCHANTLVHLVLLGWCQSWTRRYSLVDSSTCNTQCRYSLVASNTQCCTCCRRLRGQAGGKAHALRCLWDVLLLSKEHACQFYCSYEMDCLF